MHGNHVSSQRPKLKRYCVAVPGCADPTRTSASAETPSRKILVHRQHARSSTRTTWRCRSPQSFRGLNLASLLPCRHHGWRSNLARGAHRSQLKMLQVMQPEFCMHSRNVLQSVTRYHCEDYGIVSEICVQAKTVSALATNGSHYAGLLVLSDALLKEICLALERNQLHPIKWIGRLENLRVSESCE